MKNVGVTLFLFVLTAVAEIFGCYLILLITQRPGRAIWAVPAAVLSLSIFGWLLTLHPEASGRVYAAYGGVYISTALVWLWCVDGVRPDRWDIIGGAACLLGMFIIYFGPRG